MTKLNFLYFIFFFFVFSSCASELTQTVSDEQKPVIASENEKLYFLKKIDLFFTAYKTTDKVPVQGVFSQVKVNLPADLKSSNKLSVLEQLEFLIPVNGLDTQNPDRDAKILKYFFGNLRSANEIFGIIDKVNLQDHTIDVLLNFNHLQQKITMNYLDNGQDITAETVLLLKDFQALQALAALNQICEDLHKGADGKSLLWDEVAVKVVFLYE